MWPFKRAASLPVSETRASASGFTAEIMSAREAYISGSRGIAELTATVQSCISLWEAGLSMSDVEGTNMLSRTVLGLTARSLALRGEAVFIVRPDGLIPASDWDLRTKNGRATAYRLNISEAGGGTTQTALAAEVLHFRVGSDVSAPYYGQAPLKRAQVTAGLLHAVEAALCEVYENAPLGSQIVPLPESASTDMSELRTAFKGKRGSVLVVEGVPQAVAAGMHPQHDKRPDDLSPNLERSMTKETLEAARGSIGMAYGVLPALLSAQRPQGRLCARLRGIWRNGSCSRLPK